ncbi:hypothetical protein NGRA_2439, partial [Nosema granulosis]
DIILKLNTYYNRVYFQIYGQNVVLKRFLKFFDLILPYLISENEIYKAIITDFLEIKFSDDNKDNAEIPEEILKTELLKNVHILRLMLKLDTKIIYVGPKDDFVTRTVLNIQKRYHLRKLFKKVKIRSKSSLHCEVETKNVFKSVDFYILLLEPSCYEDILIIMMVETIFSQYFCEFFRNNYRFVYYKGFRRENMLKPNLIQIFIQSTVEVDQLYNIIKDLLEFFKNKINTFSKKDFILLKQTVKNKLQVEEFRTPGHVIHFLKSFCFLIDFENAKQKIDFFFLHLNNLNKFKETLREIVDKKILLPKEYFEFINNRY